ncbi:hypothetical protein CD30_17380 [Ureibacillus massiliensis 4400831 = CIP 108448 = CCUG 49529]|uniref:Uncharacterized protein n=1 Tax=Ureibacillus massiliensis 4400831 = CIP 108448 = CCUG 49529 TaxID=1211035 RepID=A0A0A3J2A1_9BACL|nr:hypothetical protein [Ureibacillus massiliensis]KGR89278.1 hypothetical protein CD30_17380 [Ureibacillus massiliensis 4400831 = CIP 108448 = CCUG 49529]BDH63555.1 hypothetical protein MTP04_36850 [Lysinibacillus sp. PLM2]
MDFLYFPEDKTEYLPVLIELLVLLVLCFIVFNLFRRISKKQELKAKEIEERILREKQHQSAPNKTEE